MSSEIKPCADCNGTGADKVKTERARQSGVCDSISYVRCRTCNGNGLEPSYPDYSRHKAAPKIP